MTTDHRYIIPPGGDAQTTNAYWALRRLMQDSLKYVGEPSGGGDILTARYKGYMVRFIQSDNGDYSVQFSNYALPTLRQELRRLVGYNQ